MAGYDLGGLFDDGVDYLGGLFDDGVDYLGNAWDSASDYVMGANPSQADWQTSQGITGSDLNLRELNGVTDSYNSLVENNGFEPSGLWSDMSKYGSQGLSLLEDNYKGIGTLGGLLGAYGDYRTQSDANDLAKQQLAMQQAMNQAALTEQQRQISKEEEAQSNMESGFGLSAFSNPNKKTTTSNYYGV